MRIERERARYDAAERALHYQIDRMDPGELVTRDTAFHDAAKMLLHAFGRDRAHDERVVMGFVGDDADVAGVAFIAGAGVRELAQIERFHATSVTMILDLIAALGM